MFVLAGRYLLTFYHRFQLQLFIPATLVQGCSVCNSPGLHRLIWEPALSSPPDKAVVMNRKIPSKSHSLIRKDRHPSLALTSQQQDLVWAGRLACAAHCPTPVRFKQGSTRLGEMSLTMWCEQQEVFLTLGWWIIFKKAVVLCKISVIFVNNNMPNRTFTSNDLQGVLTSALDV